MRTVSWYCCIGILLFSVTLPEIILAAKPDINTGLKTATSTLIDEHWGKVILLACGGVVIMGEFAMTESTGTQSYTNSNNRTKKQSKTLAPTKIKEQNKVLAATRITEQSQAASKNEQTPEPTKIEEQNESQAASKSSKQILEQSQAPEQEKTHQGTKL